jgi:hypothetical protein
MRRAFALGQSIDLNSGQLFQSSGTRSPGVEKSSLGVGGRTLKLRLVPTVRQVNFSLHPAKLYLLRSQSSLPNAYTDISLTLIKQNPSIPYCTSPLEHTKLRPKLPPSAPSPPRWGSADHVPGKCAAAHISLGPFVGFHGLDPPWLGGFCPGWNPRRQVYIYNVFGSY